MAADAHALTKRDLAEVMRSKFEEERSQIDDIFITRLTKPGDNAGSTMLAVDVTLKPGPRTLHLVAKMLPKSIMLQELFQCDVTVRKETDFYLLACPAYERIQKENNVPEDKYLDVFPVCYGARVSSKGDSGPVDDGSVILQENLKVQGYECGDRYKGLDMTHCKLVLDKLARFHATAVAIKIRKPEEFKATILRAAKTVMVGPRDINFASPLQTLPEYETLKERISTALLESKEMFEIENPKPPREPFGTFTHLDLWVNNIMFQYGPGASKETPQNLKLVDFQITRYDSPARDLLFFLYTSAELEILSNHYDYLVRWYYDNFVDCLQHLGCDTAAFPFKEFSKEIENSSKIEFWHIAFMLTAITASPEDSFDTDTPENEADLLRSNVGSTYARRASRFVQDYASRKWI